LLPAVGPDDILRTMKLRTLFPLSIGLVVLAWTSRLDAAPRVQATAGSPLVGLAKAYYNLRLGFPTRGLAAGTYQFQIVLTAATNPNRTTTLTSPTFTLGTPSGSGHGGNPDTPGRHGHGCHGRHAKRHGCSRR